MTMPENLKDAVETIEFYFRDAPSGDARYWQTIRSRLVELEAENERLRIAYARCEKADALLREAIGWNWLDDENPRPDVMDVLEQEITAHLSENGHG